MNLYLIEKRNPKVGDYDCLLVIQSNEEEARKCPPALAYLWSAMGYWEYCYPNLSTFKIDRERIDFSEWENDIKDLKVTLLKENVNSPRWRFLGVDTINNFTDLEVLKIKKLVIKATKGWYYLTFCK